MSIFSIQLLYQQIESGCYVLYETRKKVWIDHQHLFKAGIALFL